jgi:hypothetical protein
MHFYIAVRPPVIFPSSSASGGFYSKNFTLSNILLIADSRLMYTRLYFFAIALASVDFPLFGLPMTSNCSGYFSA